MGYSWYRVDSAFVQHPKTLALQAALNEPLADAYVNRLWSWVHRYAPTGLIPSRVTTQIEVALGWRGPNGRLLEALTEVGWLEVVSDGLEVHDWADYQSFWAGKARKDKNKKRMRRARSSAQSVRALSRVTAPPTDGRTDGRNGRDEPPPLQPAAPAAEVAVERPRFKALFTHMQADRQRTCLMHPEPEPDAWPDWCATVEAEGFSDRELTAAWSRYLLDDDFRVRGWPTALFLSDGIWRSRAGEVKRARTRDPLTGIAHERGH